MINSRYSIFNDFSSCFFNSFSSNNGNIKPLQVFISYELKLKKKKKPLTGLDQWHLVSGTNSDFVMSNIKLYWVIQQRVNVTVGL